VDTLTFSKILLHWLRNRRIFVAIFWPFSPFSFSKTQVKSIKIKANDRSSNKYVKTQEYYNILLSILKTKQVTSNFAAAKAPICDCPWIFRGYSEFSQTCSRYALLLKWIRGIASKIIFLYLTKIWAPFLDKKFEAGVWKRMRRCLRNRKINFSWPYVWCRFNANTKTRTFSINNL